MNNFLNGFEEAFYWFVRIVGVGLLFILALIPIAMYAVAGYMIAFMFAMIPVGLLTLVIPGLSLDVLPHVIATLLLIGFGLINLPRNRNGNDVE